MTDLFHPLVQAHIARRAAQEAHQRALMLVDTRKIKTTRDALKDATTALMRAEEKK